MPANKNKGDKAMPTSDKLRKRKQSSRMKEEPEDLNEDDHTSIKDKCARENHREIEKRRRNKMNAYVTELSDMLPNCSNLPRRPDKLTILKMAVNHMKSLKREEMESRAACRSSFLSDQEIKQLILEAADGFLFVVSCETGSLLYVSDAISSVLKLSQDDWTGRSLYDLVHPEDAVKIREQLSNIEVTHISNDYKSSKDYNEQGDDNVDNRSDSVNTRKSFICRMQYGNGKYDIEDDKDQFANSNLNGVSNKYKVIHCTGYVKSWSPAEIVDDDSSESSFSSFGNENGIGTCLVTIGKLQLATVPTVAEEEGITFVCRHDINGTFIFVDQRITSITGFLPKQLLGDNIVNYCHSDDRKLIEDSFKQVLVSKNRKISLNYRFRAINNNWIWLHNTCYCFLNPCSGQVEYIVCDHRLNKVANSESTTLNLDNQEKMPIGSHSSVNYIKPNSDIYKLVNSSAQLGEVISRNDLSVPTVDSKIKNSSDVRHGIVSDVSTPLPNISPSQFTPTFSSSETHDMLLPNRDQCIRDMINIQEQGNQIPMCNNIAFKASRNLQRQQNSSLHNLQLPQQSENYAEQMELQRENRNNIYSKFTSNFTFENENILNDDNSQGLVNAVGSNNVHLNSHWNPDCDGNFEGIDTKSQLWKKRNQLNFASQNENQSKILGVNRYSRPQAQRYPSQSCSSSVDTIESQQPRLDHSIVNQSKNGSREQTIGYNQVPNVVPQQSGLPLIDNSQDFPDMIQFFDELLQE